MWAFRVRHFMIVAIACMAMLMPRLPLNAQESKPQPKDFWQTDDGAWMQGAVHVVASGDPYGALGAYSLACQHIDAWRLPAAPRFWLSSRGLHVQGALQVFGAGNPLGVLAVRVLASEDPSPLVLEDDPKWRFEFDEPLPLPSHLLSLIRDRRPFPQVQPHELKGPDLAWYLVFNKALEYSHRDNMDLDKFKKGAEANKFVVFPDLVAQPGMYRGKIIPVRGELIVVRQKGAPRLVGRDLQHIYTGYIVGPTKGVAPYTIAFTELPDEIKAIPEHQWEKLSLEVTFHGYFLSLVAFPVEKGIRSPNDVISPYLVGRSLIVHGKLKPKAAEEEGSYSYPIIAGTVGGIVGIVILGALLNLWFKRGDRRIHSRLAEVRDKQNPFNLEPAEPEPAPETGIKPVEDANPPAS